MLQLMYLELGKIFKQLKREKKSEKKNKKNEREDGCLRLHWYRGGRGIAFIVGLLCIVLQRFATLVCFVAYGFNMRDIGEER